MREQVTLPERLYAADALDDDSAALLHPVQGPAQHLAGYVDADVNRACGANGIDGDVVDDRRDDR